MPRTDRRPDDLRPLSFQRGYTGQAPGSVLVRAGRTAVLCTCTVEPAVPPFRAGSGQGWLTAEYGMLPGSTNTRKPRDKGGKVDGRSVEMMYNAGRHEEIALYCLQDVRATAELYVKLESTLLMFEPAFRDSEERAGIAEYFYSEFPPKLRDDVPPAPSGSRAPGGIRNQLF